MALAKDLIAKLNEASRRARRSRSDYVQIILEDYFDRLEEGEEKLATPRKYVRTIARS